MKVTKPNKNSKEKETNILYLEGSAVYEWICQPPGMKLVRTTTSRQQLLNVFWSTYVCTPQYETNI